MVCRFACWPRNRNHSLKQSRKFGCLIKQRIENYGSSSSSFGTLFGVGGNTGRWQGGSLQSSGVTTRFVCYKPAEREVFFGRCSNGDNSVSRPDRHCVYTISWFGCHSSCAANIGYFRR